MRHVDYPTAIRMIRSIPWNLRKLIRGMGRYERSFPIQWIQTYIPTIQFDGHSRLRIGKEPKKYTKTKTYSSHDIFNAILFDGVDPRVFVANCGTWVWELLFTEQRKQAKDRYRKSVLHKDTEIVQIACDTEIVHIASVGPASILRIPKCQRKLLLPLIEQQFREYYDMTELTVTFSVDVGQEAVDFRG